MLLIRYFTLLSSYAAADELKHKLNSSARIFLGRYVKRNGAQMEQGPGDYTFYKREVCKAEGYVPRTENVMRLSVAHKARYTYRGTGCFICSLWNVYPYILKTFFIKLVLFKCE